MAERHSGAATARPTARAKVSGRNPRERREHLLVAVVVSVNVTPRPRRPAGGAWLCGPPSGPGGHD